MKKIIKKFLPKALWSHMTFLKTLIFKGGYFALNGIDKKLEKNKKENGSYAYSKKNEGIWTQVIRHYTFCYNVISTIKNINPN